MKKSITAALLSAFLLPGSGHFYLKKPIHGTVFFAITFISLYFIFSALFKISNSIIARIQMGEIPLDVAKISELVSQQLVASDEKAMNIPLLILFICWFVSIIHSYKIGRTQDMLESGGVPS